MYHIKILFVKESNFFFIIVIESVIYKERKHFERENPSGLKAYTFWKTLIDKIKPSCF